jgi:hypothetical protein
MQRDLDRSKIRRVRRATAPDQSRETCFPKAEYEWLGLMVQILDRSSKRAFADDIDERRCLAVNRSVVRSSWFDLIERNDNPHPVVL